jgi:succinate dehydrogenase/fumarate reductase flavoprotein subunit
VPGLYAAGDTATRELICGGFTGGGSHNAAWAASSGSWAGQGAAGFALRRGRQHSELHAVGEAGIRPTGSVRIGHRDVIAEVQRQVLPYELNYLRNGDLLGPALKSLHDTWSEVRAGLGADGEDLFRVREAAAMVAHGRWMYHSALTRTETRGMHKRLDYPMQNPTQGHRLLTGGLDEIWSRPESARLAA